METPGTLLISRRQIAELASPRDYLAATHQAFAGLAAGAYTLSSVGHIACTDGGFHIKSAVATGPSPVAAIKVNGNFPGNASRYALPTIQGFIALLDAARGTVLALMDSIEITARRTAAATALAARHLARRDSEVLGIVGCGVQASYHVEALLDVAAIRRVRFCDPREEAALAFARFLARLGLEGERETEPSNVAYGADIVVTLSTSTQPLLSLADIAEGTFVAGVGADNPSKHELAADLLQGSRVVPDLLAQAATLGDLHHAIRAGAMTADDIHAELASIVAGTAPGRTSARERFVFDSTGTAVQDVAAAAMIYDRARESGSVPMVLFNDTSSG